MRSGKSAFALKLARQFQGRRVFVATAQPLDAEMQERISLHRIERGPDFETIEEPIELAERLGALRDIGVVVVDCLTIWLSNLLMRDVPPQRIVERVEGVIALIGERRFNAVLVTNEVGMGLIPENALGRVFRDLTGLTHQRMAAAVDQIYLALLGSMIRIKPDLTVVRR